MTYETAQVVSQFVAMAIFMALAIGVGIYAFRPENKARFDKAAHLPLESDNHESAVN